MKYLAMPIYEALMANRIGAPAGLKDSTDEKKVDDFVRHIALVQHYMARASR